jgi:uncharacterized protein YbjQ (UPF0145 family)
MIKEAEELGANAVIGVKIDYKDYEYDKHWEARAEMCADRDWDGSAVVGRAGGGQP